MTDTVSEAAVDAATLAMLKACGGECIEAPTGELCAERLGCACRAEARAALEAALPLLVAGERARAAMIAEDKSADYDIIFENDCCSYAGRRIASAIRADKGESSA